jgi:hypothetical protein
LISSLKKNEPIDFLKSEVPRMNNLTEKRFQFLEALLVDTAKLDVSVTKVEWLRAITVASFLIFLITFCLGVKLASIGYGEWRAAEKRAEPITKANAGSHN